MSEDYGSVLARYNYQVQEDKNTALMESLKSDPERAEKDGESETAVGLTGPYLGEKLVGYLKDKGTETLDAIKDNVSDTLEKLGSKVGESVKNVFSGSKSATDTAIDNIGDADKAGALRTKFDGLRTEYNSAKADLELASKPVTGGDVEAGVTRASNMARANSRLAEINTRSNALVDEVNTIASNIKTNLASDIEASAPKAEGFTTTFENPAFEYKLPEAFEDPMAAGSYEGGLVKFGADTNYAELATTGVARVPVMPTAEVAIARVPLATEDILGQGGLGTRLGALGSETFGAAKTSIQSVVNNPTGNALRATEVEAATAKNTVSRLGIEEANVASGAETAGEAGLSTAGEVVGEAGAEDLAIAGGAAGFGPIGVGVAAVAILGAALWHLFDPDESKPAVIPTPNYSNPVFQPGAR